MNNMIEDFPLFVTMEDDDSMTIEWDPNHPVTSFFNSWTDEDFKEMILAECARVLEGHGK